MTGEYDGSIRFNTEIDDSALPEQMEKVGDKLRTLSATLRDVMQGPIAAVMELGAAFNQLKGTLDGLENEWAKQEQSVAILNSTLRATGATSWTSSEALQGMASSLQKLTGYSDDAVISMESILLGFKHIQGVQFNEAVEQVLNVSKVMGIDLRSAAREVGKALDEPAEGLDALMREGFRFTDSQKEVIKHLVETGDRAGAQKIILDRLSASFGGTAAAAYDTSSALRDKLATAITDMHKQMGAFVSEALAPMRKSLIEATENIETWFKRINENGQAPELLDKLATALGMVTAGLAAFVLVSQGSAIVEGMTAAITALNAALLANPYALAAAGIAAVAVAVAGFIKIQKDHATAMENSIAKSVEMQEKAKTLADEYQNLHDKANLTATEQDRMATIAKTLIDQYPNLNQATLDAAAAHGELAKKIEEAAIAQTKLYASGQISKLKEKFDELSITYAGYEKTLEAVQTGKQALPSGYKTVDSYKAMMAEALKKIYAIADQVTEYEDFVVHGIIPKSFTSKPADKPTTGGTPSAVPEGYAAQLEDLDKEHAAIIAVAEQTGDDTVAIDAEYYKKRLDLLGSFVAENAKKNILAADSLKQALGGKYKTIGEEIQATLTAQQNNTQFTPEGATLDAAGQKVQQGDVTEWIEGYLGKEAFDKLMADAEQRLQNTDVSEWEEGYLGKEVFDALMAAAEQRIQNNDVAEFEDNWIKDKIMKSLLDNAETKIQTANAMAYLDDYVANHGTTQGGGDLWLITYNRYMDEMREKTSLLYPLIQGIKTSWKQTIDDMGEKVNDWKGVINTAFNAVTSTIGGAFETLGQQIAGQTGGWTNWGNAALKALAGVLRAIGYQLLAQAAYNAALGIAHLLMLDFAGAAAAASSAAVALAAGGAALVGAGIVDGMADANTETHKFTDALAQQNETLKKSIELWTQAGKAGEAYSSILDKVKEAATQFYNSLQSIGQEITSSIIDSLVNGFSGDDFLYSIEQYITKAVIQAAVFTESFMAEVASIGKEIATGIANGFSEDELKSLKERLATLYQNAAAAANIATNLVQQAFTKYDTGTMDVRGDQLAMIHNSEMILPPGIAQEARMKGVYIGPVGNIDAAGSAAFPRNALNINLTLDGAIQIDGREIGRVAFEYSDRLAEAAYGSH